MQFSLPSAPPVILPYIYLINCGLPLLSEEDRIQFRLVIIKLRLGGILSFEEATWVVATTNKLRALMSKANNGEGVNV